MQILVNTDQYSIRWPSIQGMRQILVYPMDTGLFDNGQKKRPTQWLALKRSMKDLFFNDSFGNRLIINLQSNKIHSF